MDNFSYSFWDERYSSEEYIYGLEPNEFFSESIKNITPGKMFLPGEGEGRNAVFAAKLGWQVVAVDQSQVGKEKAENLAELNEVNINYQVADIANYRFTKNKYDAIALIFFHLPMPLRIKIHKKFITSLKPGGRFILEMFNKEQLGKTSGGPQNLDMLYSDDDIKRDFSSLKTILLENKIVTLKEGAHHHGEASVIRYIGIKE